MTPRGRWPAPPFLAALALVAAEVGFDALLRTATLSGFSAREWRQYALGVVGSVGVFWALFNLAAVPVKSRALDAARAVALALAGALLLFAPVAFWLLQRRFPNEAAWLFFVNEWRFVLRTAGDKWDARPMLAFLAVLGSVVALGWFTRRAAPSRRALWASVLWLATDAVALGVSRLSPSLPLPADANTLRLLGRVVSWGGAPPRFFRLEERVPSLPRGPVAPLPFNVLLVVHETMGQAWLEAPDGRAVTPRLLALKADPAVVVLRRLNAVSSCTDVSVPSILTGVSSASAMAWQRSAVLPFDLARLAGAYTFVSSSQRTSWANLRTWLDAPAITHYRGAEDFQADADDDSGVPDALVYADSLAAMDEAHAQGRRFVGLLRTNGTHGPYQVDVADQPFTDDAGFGPGEAGGFRNYLNALHRVDRGFGGFWDELKRRPYFEETVVVITADHGESFGQHGLWAHCGNFYPEESRVPGVLRFPKALREDSRGAAALERLRAQADAFTTTTSVVPTLADLLGWREHLAGQFDAPSWVAPTATERPVVFTNCSDLRGCASADLGVYAQGTRFVYSGEAKRWQAYDDAADPQAKVDVWAERRAVLEAALEQLQTSEREGGVVRRVLEGR